MDHPLIERLKLREGILVETTRKVKAELKKAPKGRLKFIRRNTRVEYYWVEPKTGRRRYITKNNLPFAMALAQKSYNKHALKLAEEELKLIRQLINQIMKGTVDGVYDILAKERKQLINPRHSEHHPFRNEQGAAMPRLPKATMAHAAPQPHTVACLSYPCTSSMRFMMIGIASVW